MADFLSGIKELQNNNIDRAIEIFEEASKKGDYHASYQLAQMYNQGLSVKKDLALAGEYFDVAFRQINEAQTTNETNYLLGTFYLFGLGTVAKDEPRAFELFQKCADNNDVNGIVMVSNCYINGIGVEKDVVEGYNYIQKVKDSKHPLAYKIYADCKLRGYGTEVDEKEAIRYYELAKDAGDVNSLFALGTIYHEGRGVAVDEKKSFEYFEKAALYNIPDALKNLAYFYSHGIYVEKNFEKEAEYLKRYADTGSKEGTFIYATVLLDAHKRLFRYKEGLDYLKRAVALREPKATHLLGKIYENGEYGVFKNPGLAFNHYLTAYNLGLKIAAFDVLRCYKQGIGTAANNKAKIEEFEAIVEELTKANNHRA